MISLVGSAVTYVVMPVLVYSITGSATWTALVAVAEGLPYLLTGLWAGALADHVDRRTIMVVSDVCGAVVLATIPVAAWLDALTAPHVLIVGFVAQTVFVFFDAANQGALPSLVSRERLPSANSLVFGGSTVVDTIVPALVGLLLVVVTPSTLISIDVVTFVASALLVRAIVRPLSGQRSTRPPRWSAVVEGLRFIARHEVIRVMIVVGSLQAFSGGAFVAVLVVWADETLGIREGDWQLGLLFGLWGAGAVLGSVLMPRMMRRFGAVRTALIFLPLSAISGVLTALTTSWPVAVAAVMVWGMMYMGVASTSLTLRQLVTPEPLMSRVMTAGRMVSFGAGYPLGALVAGLLAEQYGAARAILLCQTTIIVGALGAWISPLRKAPRELSVADHP